MANRTPLIVAVALLLLPVLYLASYWALVVPAGVPHMGVFNYSGGRVRPPTTDKYYRWAPYYASTFFYPLEQMDRQLRPNAWPDPVDEFRVPDNAILFEIYDLTTNTFISCPSLPP